MHLKKKKKKVSIKRNFGNHLIFNTIFIYKNPISNDLLYERKREHQVARSPPRTRLRRRQTSIGGGGAHDRRRHARPTVQTNTFLSPALPPLRLWALEKFQTTISG